MYRTKRLQVSSLIFVFTLLVLAACNDKPVQTPKASEPAPASPSDQPVTSTAQPAPTPAPVPPPPPPPPPPVVIPAGTVLTVRLRQSLGSKTSNEGDRFSAALAEPILADGKPVAVAGSKTSGTVTEAHAAGRFKCGASLGMVLRMITIAGHHYQIVTEPAALATKGKGKRTAGMVGGGAAGGALIGGVAGGGGGAAVGALVGAGVGTVGAAFTGKRDIELPVESLLTFKMTRSLTLESQSSDQEPASQPK
jgi:hypothetical protein